ncbi:aminobutyraldehyde dehydrogenase [Rhodococcus globerulus]|uniref:Aminobutyraldehyde dehydrogenase n=1 Tax=Rhodococcus globerulus TaxID=33008 RepID=A0ABU4C3G6_RHOGO|nr:aminobutyraldehyde dehydrogenase [Rhodococcus globerulus]MDV6270806.1 aminobutyraldehyde dehydrogenase [Rhodococcus globerulus]
MTTPLEHFINGQFRPAHGTSTTPLIDPMTEKPSGDAPNGDATDVDRAVAAATAAFPAWSQSTPKTRQLALLRLADAVELHADDLAAAQHRNTGQPVSMIVDEEVAAGADSLRFFAGAARTLEGRSAAEYLEGHTSYIRRESVGVIGQVTPWNYPLLMALWKIGPAIAAGNTVVLKPSETTPESTLCLAAISRGILPDGVFNVVLGEADTGSALVEHPGVAMVSITGSVRAGTSVAAAAAQHHKRAHLELGGNAPAIVFEDADLNKVAESVSAAAYFNAGQDCTAASRVIVHESVHDDLVDALVAIARSTTTGPDAKDPFYGPLNNARQLQAVSTKIAELSEHAVIRIGGHRVGERGYYFAPTVITNVEQSDAIVQDETFGPVLTVQRFTDDKEAIALANDVRYGLAASVWTEQNGRAQRISNALDFGAVWINCHIPLVAEMPHGGFKHSGHGKDLSLYGLEEYTRIKHVMTDHRDAR